MPPSTIRLLAILLLLLLTGWAVKTWRERAHVEPVKAGAGVRHKG